MRIIRHTNWIALTVSISIVFLLPSLSTAAKKTEIAGMIDIDYPDVVEPKLEINLGGAIFALAANSMKEENPEVSEFLVNLKAVKMRLYELAGLGVENFSEALKFYQKQIQEPEWEVLARVNDEDSKVGVYTFTKEDVVSGLVVLVGNPEEIVVVNVAGKIDISKMPALAKIPAIGGIAGLVSGMDIEPDFVVRGVVKDAKTGKPIEGARVSDGKYGLEPRKGANTDAEGKYSYHTWYEEHSIIARAPGYKPQRKTLVTKLLAGEKEKVIDFELVPEDD